MHFSIFSMRRSPVRFPPTVALTPWVAANIFKKEESDLETSDSETSA